MMGEEPGSITRWLDAYKAGDRAAVPLLWERYFTDLVRLARKKLGPAGGLRVAEDE
jgi:hypothetical protein